MEVDNLAVPPESVTAPRVVAPLLKVTVPVGVPKAPAETVAVKVIVCPYVEGLSEEITLVVVTAAFVTSDKTADVLTL
jgi:hypothetical protein